MTLEDRMNEKILEMWSQVLAETRDDSAHMWQLGKTYQYNDLGGMRQMVCVPNTASWDWAARIPYDEEDVMGNMLIEEMKKLKPELKKIAETYRAEALLSPHSFVRGLVE